MNNSPSLFIQLLVVTKGRPQHFKDNEAMHAKLQTMGSDVDDRKERRLDLQSRSMRDNLIFVGFQETHEEIDVKSLPKQLIKDIGLYVFGSALSHVFIFIQWNDITKCPLRRHDSSIKNFVEQYGTNFDIKCSVG
jgi:hypothetical protein